MKNKLQLTQSCYEYNKRKCEVKRSALADRSFPPLLLHLLRGPLPLDFAITSRRAMRRARTDRSRRRNTINLRNAICLPILLPFLFPLKSARYRFDGVPIEEVRARHNIYSS